MMQLRMILLISTDSFYLLSIFIIYEIKKNCELSKGRYFYKKPNLGMISFHLERGTWYTIMNYEPPRVTLADASLSSPGLDLGEEGSQMLHCGGKAELALLQ